MDILRGKWTVHILCEVLDGPVRFGELKRKFPAASKKALTSSLRGLEAAEFIVRRDLSKSVLHVEYELARCNHEPLAALLDYLAEWSVLFLERAKESAS
jgi:DNA-binding HxlR family transcriptional regulator